jgi:hypothetical protein
MNDLEPRKLDSASRAASVDRWRVHVRRDYRISRTGRGRMPPPGGDCPLLRTCGSPREDYQLSDFGYRFLDDPEAPEATLVKLPAEDDTMTFSDSAANSAPIFSAHVDRCRHLVCRATLGQTARGRAPERFGPSPCGPLRGDLRAARRLTRDRPLARVCLLVSNPGSPK